MVVTKPQFINRIGKELKQFNLIFHPQEYKNAGLLLRNKRNSKSKCAKLYSENKKSLRNALKPHQSLKFYALAIHLDPQYKQGFQVLVNQIARLGEALLQVCRKDMMKIA